MMCVLMLVCPETFESKILPNHSTLFNYLLLQNTFFFSLGIEVSALQASKIRCLTPPGMIIIYFK